MKKLNYYGLEFGNGLLALVLTNEENEAFFVYYYRYDQEIECLAYDIKKIIEESKNYDDPTKVIREIECFGEEAEDPAEEWKELENDYEEALLNNSERPYEIITEGYINL